MTLQNITTIIWSFSDQSPLFHFDLGQDIFGTIGDTNTGLDDIGWPAYLSDDFNALAPTS